MCLCRHKWKKRYKKQIYNVFHLSIILIITVPKNNSRIASQQAFILHNKIQADLKSIKFIKEGFKW